MTDDPRSDPAPVSEPAPGATMSPPRAEPLAPVQPPMSRLPAALRPMGLRTAAFYAAVFGAFGVHLPFWPLWLAGEGLSAAEIGVFGAAGMAARVVAGFALPALADRWDARRNMLLALGILGVVATLAHLVAPDRAWLMAATLALSAAFAGLVPIGDALGAAASRVHGFEYAHVRSIGSASFLAVSLAMGVVIGAAGPGAAPWAIAGFLLMAAWTGLTHPGGGRARAARRPTMTEIRALAAAPMFMLFVAAIGLSQSSHGIYYAYGSIHWRDLGLSDARIGALWAFGVAVEVVLMAAYGGLLIRRLGAAGAIALSAAAGVLRWSAMAFDPVGPALWALQTLHALSFAAGHLGAIAFIAAAAPERLAAAAQGVFGAVAGGLLTAAAMALAAWVYPIAGGATYGLAAAMSAAGLALALLLRRRWDGGALAV
jgi:PPP family 3-phenylpropionic acid transporter